MTANVKCAFEQKVQPSTKPTLPMRWH